MPPGSQIVRRTLQRSYKVAHGFPARDVHCTILSTILGTSFGAERRRGFRVPFPRLLHLVPADLREVSSSEGMVVVGSSLSENGIGFFHPHAISWRRVIASLELKPDEWVGLHVQIAWCRFTKLGWYESGGVIRGIISSPLALPESAL